VRRSEFERSGSGAQTVCKKVRGVRCVYVYLIKGQTTPPSLPFSSQEGGIPGNKVQGSLHHLSRVKGAKGLV